MYTKMFLLLVLLFAISFNVNAQLEGKKFLTDYNGTSVFYLEFKSDSYELSDSGGNILLKGVYTVEDKIITFTDTEGPMSCPSDQTGRYEFEINGKKLSLKLIGDECEGRPKIAATDWQLVEK
jgi:hypothetical protein